MELKKKENIKIKKKLIKKYLSGRKLVEEF